ncbi:hypothetical protein PWT90_05738 [Aphanocladium album]|nr:hypothetical protein PWT90_05738 [Aphanocladium album]
MDVGETPRLPRGKGENSNNSGKGRQKRWHLRTRTGCTTCRLRRVKCDESKPSCKVCVAGHRTCYYALAPATSETPGHSGVDSALREEWLQRRARPKDLQVFDWEFHDSLRFFLEVVLPDLNTDAQLPARSMFVQEKFPRKMFQGSMIVTYLEKASKARGRILRPGEDPAFEATWTGYFRSLQYHITTVNQFLCDDAKYTNGAPAAFPILQLLILDLHTMSPLWRAHLRGFFAYVRSRGGATAMMRLRIPEMARLRPALSFTMQVNTTCPARQLIEGSDDFTDEEIRALIDFDTAAFEPCPIEFHLARVRITRLRAYFARGTQLPVNPRMRYQLQDILDAVWLFDVRGWIEEKFHDKDDEKQKQAATMARIYAVAIRLYGILTLPQSDVVAWAGSSAEIGNRYPTERCYNHYKSVRKGHRDELLGMLREHWDSIKWKMWLQWPLTVLGVAVADGTAGEKEFIDESLFAVWRDTTVHVSSIAALEKLRAFWLSGKTAWEDCFDEPIPPGQY